MNRRDMKKQIYRALATFLNQRNREWSSIPSLFADIELNVFRDRTPTRSEEDRLRNVLHEISMEFYSKGGIK
jgi:hypothetical protein